jgi:ABC-type Fe3+-hydroxamate transport system substrate-binding protein
MTKVFTDMLGRAVEINFPPKRIVSLVPSQTELLYDLGLEDEVVGITKFCVHPEKWFRNKKRVGGTKTVHTDIVRELQPDLIIANKEENTREQIEELASMCPTWVSDIRTLDEALRMIRQVGELTGKGERANELAKNIEHSFAVPHNNIPRRVVYFIWRGPWMSVGGDTFISDIIERMGWQNVLADKERYPAIELSELISMGVDLVLLSSEPYPFKEKHIDEVKAVLPGAQVVLADGEMFSWYGSRLVKAAAYLKNFAAEINGSRNVR